MEFQDSSESSSLNPNSNVWRYMPLEKFLDLITSHSLYFANAKTMTDQYEVSIPNGLKDKFLRTHSQEEFDEVEKRINQVRARLFVNCWSIQTGESYALWKIYLGGSKAGVAIKTKVHKLKKTIVKENQNRDVTDMYIEKVRYKKHGVLFQNLTFEQIAATKTKFYEYENELRLFYFINDDNRQEDLQPSFSPPSGMRISINSNELIDAIYLSPFCGDWVKNSLEKLLDKTHPALAEKIRLSEILDV